MLYQHRYIRSDNTPFKPIAKRGTFRLFVLADLALVVLFAGLLAYAFRAQESGVVAELRNELMEVRSQLVQSQQIISQVESRYGVVLGETNEAQP